MTAADKRKNPSGFRGLSLNLLNIVMVMIGIVVAVLMVVNNYKTNESYRLMDAVIKESLLSQNATGMMESISSGMSGSALAFAETGDPSHVYSYIGQMNTLNEEFAETGMLSESRQAEDPDLAQAVAAFHTLRDTEWTAMRLKAESLSMPMTAFPEQLQAVALPEEYASLPAEEKAEKAVALLNAPEYAGQKTQLAGSVDASHRFVSERASERTAGASEQMKQVVYRQKILIILFIAIAFVALVLNRMMVLHPLVRSADLLDRREPIPVRGSSEMRHLAEVYNDVLRDNEKKREALSYAATHDPLTDLLNRAAFDSAYRQYSKGRIGILVVDVDTFKHFNDEFGHDTGDRVLIRVADELRHSFRGSDLICRIGGDEFCIIMTDADSSQADRVRTTVRSINESLAADRKDLPAITVSVGAAFWDRANPGPDIFRDADTALYQVKRHGKSDCAVYGTEA